MAKNSSSSEVQSCDAGADKRLSYFLKLRKTEEMLKIKRKNIILSKIVAFD
jgi:hypothetical protein